MSRPVGDIGTLLPANGMMYFLRTLIISLLSWLVAFWRSNLQQKISRERFQAFTAVGVLRNAFADRSWRVASAFGEDLYIFSRSRCKAFNSQIV
jgi:hypothetical protein